MIVECPRCRARYRVEAGLLEQDQTFKCSRCSHIFAYEAEAAAPTQAVRPPEPPRMEPPPPKDEAAPEPAVEQPRIARSEPPPANPQRPDPTPEPLPPRESLSFSFPSREEPEEEAEEPEARDDDEPAPPPPPAFVSRDRSPSSEFSFGEDDEEQFSDRDDEPDDALDEQPRFVRGEEEFRIQDEESTNPTRSYLGFLAALVIAYGILSLDLLNHPARAEKLLAAVPLVGDTIAQDQLLQIKVRLEDVEGIYQQIKDDRAVFIVSGRAINTSSQALKGVQIESALYDQTGKAIDVKNIYCGNAMSLKIVKDLSSKEISLLQRLEPPKRFEIRPGESAGFSVVFLAPPTGVKEFTTRVVSAQASLS